METSEAELVVLMEQAFSAVDEVCSQLTDQQWDLATDLEGWSVKDNLSHLTHFESVASGMPQPEPRSIEHLAHIRNDFQKMNEVGVEARRPLPGPVILEEFREATTKRLKYLAGLDEQSWTEAGPTPMGEMKARDFLGIRILDVLFHEQDIRRATGIAGHLDGGVARYVFERFATLSMPRVIGKSAGAPDGSSVVLDVGAPGRRVGYLTEGGRTSITDPPSEPTATIAADIEAYLCLMGGRRTRAQLGDRVRVSGDTALAGRIIDALTVVP